MSDHKIALHTAARVVEIGDEIELEFVPEVAGDVYLQRYADMAEETDKARKGLFDDEGEEYDAAEVVERGRRIRAASVTFVTSFMLPDSAAGFEELRLPDRVLGELVTWIAGAYGGKDHTGSSNDSAPPSSNAGKRSTPPSRRKGSKSAGGR